MACILPWSSAVRVHDSQAYRKMDVRRERISRILELAEHLARIYHLCLYVLLICASLKPELFTFWMGSQATSKMWWFTNLWINMYSFPISLVNLCSLIEKYIGWQKWLKYVQYFFQPLRLWFSLLYTVFLCSFILSNVLIFFSFVTNDK